jgi:hypothetical protein
MPREGFEPAIPATKRPQTYALDRAATGIGRKVYTEFRSHSISQSLSVTSATKSPSYVFANAPSTEGLQRQGSGWLYPRLGRFLTYASGLNLQAGINMLHYRCVRQYLLIISYFEAFFLKERMNISDSLHKLRTSHRMSFSHYKQNTCVSKI